MPASAHALTGLCLVATNSKPPEKPWPVMRAMWYEVGSSDKLYPLEEKEAFILEASHCQQDWRTVMVGVPYTM